MASVELLLPFLKKWEGGFVNDPDDAGGATNMGVTLRTYRAYCSEKGLPEPGVEQLKNIPELQWKEIVKAMYWDKCRADEIQSQGVANIIVDWFWMSGATAIRRVQKIIHVNPDGIAGKQTVAAINSRNAGDLFGEIKSDRVAYYDEICASRPANEKFRKGWMNRLNDLTFDDLVFND